MRILTAGRIFFLALGCLLLPHYAAAQNTLGSASLIFDDETGILYGYSATDPDYSVQGYYNSWIVGGLFDITHDGPEGYGFTYLDVQSNMGPGRVEQATQAEAQPGTLYKLESLHQIQAIYYEYFYLDPPNDPEDRYVDYYNFESAGGYNFEYTHTFHGPGPRILMDAGSRVIDLGTTYDQKQTGVPHHLKVIADVTTTLPGALTDTAGCGQKQRRLTYRVVDSAGKGVGRVRVEETFPGTITSTCTGNTVSPSGCSDTDDARGTFVDTLRTGCPSTGGTCGFDVTPDTWSWCPLNGSAVVLMRANYSVRYHQITVKGQQSSWAGTDFYP